MCSFDYSELRKALKSQRWTITALARELNITRGALSMKLNEHSNLTTSQIQSIANVLNISNDEYKTYFFTQKVMKSVHND